MTINDSGRRDETNHGRRASSATGNNIQNGSMTAAATKSYLQQPVAVIGLSCRLPGESSSPRKLWDFLMKGGVARNRPPDTRFNLDGQYDGSTKPRTMRSPGGMFLENIDPQDIDAPFFGLSKTEATAMDPQVRQVLEVVYEAIENAGLTLEGLSGSPFGCFTGSFAGDYADIQARDPEDRVPNVTIGIGRAMLSNRVSHFLNTKGPSMTIDTACSGSLVGLDVACRYLQTGEISGAIVSGCNLYLSPEHNMDLSAMKGANTLSGKCHTFDSKADGYVKAEAVNCVIVKRLEDAIRDKDPIRAVIRGSATNSDGWTAGIASPSSEAQAAATRQAYINAGIKDLSQTGYLECHGTGTQAGDPIETNGVSSVFSPSRDENKPLIIGSIKSNVGHSEPAAGLSGLIKAILTVENGIIPGNPTFITPNPKINFDALRVRATRTAIPWPRMPFRRASLNSFGYGGSNVHVIIDEPSTLVNKSQLRHTSSYASSGDDLFAETKISRPHLLVLSGNDEPSLSANVGALRKHLANPSTSIELQDLAYTLSERRSRHFQRAYVVTNTIELAEGQFTFGKPTADRPRIGFVFTGQGAQWSQMGKELVQTFPEAAVTLKRLDAALQSLKKPPKWSLLDELTQPRKPEQLRLPEFSQPLVTALQLALSDIFKSWGVQPIGVVGHSSGEIAAASAAGLISQEEAIKIAFLRGQAASDLGNDSQTTVGMLAVGLGADEVLPYLKDSEGMVQIACYNSPNSVTLSGSSEHLDAVRARIQADGHFARLLQVDLAYHSKFMTKISAHYRDLLMDNCDEPLKVNGNREVQMYSSVTEGLLDRNPDATYWHDNMVSPVKFEQAFKAMVAQPAGPTFLIELGPSGALSGPIAQIKKSLSGIGSTVFYLPALKRGADSIKPLFDTAGQLFLQGGHIDLAIVNKSTTDEPPKTVIDLPNYVWNHSTKYWHESSASKDWRFRQFGLHDLLGSKILGSPWRSPNFKKVLNVADLSWLRDHRMGHEIVFPAAGYIAMAMEALRQKREATAEDGADFKGQNCYRLRNITFAKALVLTESENQKVVLSLVQRPGSKDLWHEFIISSETDDIWTEHCKGLVSFGRELKSNASESELRPLEFPVSAKLWYKAMSDAGYSFGESFQKQLLIESVAGQPRNRSTVDLKVPPSEYIQSDYPMHPTCIDGCFQTAAPSLWRNHRSSVNAVLVPAMIDNLVIQTPTHSPEEGLAISTADYIGVGRIEETKNWKSDVTVLDPTTGELLMQLSGLRYHKLDTREDLNAAHSYACVTWRPDINSLTQDGLWAMGTENTAEQESAVARILDLMVHKKQNAKIMEVNMLPNNSESTWVDEASDKRSRTRCLKYLYGCPDAPGLIEAKGKYSSWPVSEFSIVDLSQEKFAPQDEEFDLVIVKMNLAGDSTNQIITRNARSLLCEGGKLLLISISPNDIVNGEASHLDDQMKSALQGNGFERPIDIASEINGNSASSHAWLAIAGASKSSSNTEQRNVELVRFAVAPKRVCATHEALARLGWQVNEHTMPFDDLPQKAAVLVLDDLWSPTLTTIGKDQWQALQTLVARECRILWVTTGSQFQVTNPDNSMVHGLARTLRAEDPSLVFKTLDVESADSLKTPEAIDEALKQLYRPQAKTHIESELVERGGITYIGRVTVDEPLNHVQKEDVEGGELQLRSLHDSPTCIRLGCERLGMIDSLQWGEVSPEELPLLGDDFVEVEVFAAGLNFKDIAVTMGIVPENQYLLGLEGAGIVRRVGKSATQFSPGQRVLVHKKGCFANRVQATIDGVHALPDDMTFEQASTLACVYLVSIYGLYHLANLQKNQTVLIHSASGGVGMASIQLAQHKGAEIYATAGTPEKRQFLTENFGIPESHIFSSRNTEFASKLMEMTGGKGVNVILNSLTGEILQESWRCIADGGTMIEIGKKDILDRNSLSMEPFNRNASFRAVDMSHKSIDDPLTGRLLRELFELIKHGHVKPISRVQTFPFEDIPAAFRFMRGGSHIGKIVITSGPDAKVEVPVRPAKRELALRNDVSYLIIGGLKGLCGSLAIYLARHGAKNLVVMSRSGYADEKSSSVLRNLDALGCQYDLCVGDVVRLEDVQNAFRTARKPIAGLIQGAMILKDRIFGSMTVEEFHDAGRAKIQGTWNLHQAAAEQKAPLDFFTMLSSISGVIGQKGQANYASANAFLDAFAIYRQSQGLRACTVDLGVIEDVGYIAEREDLAARLDNTLWNVGINESLLHRILGYSIMQQQPRPLTPQPSTQLITGIPVPQAMGAELLRDARFSTLCFGNSAGASTAGDGQDSSTILQTISLLIKGQAEASVILATVIDAVNQQFMKTLVLTEPVEPAKPLSSYGMDSLAAVEFRNWARTGLGAELTTLEITNARSLSTLCETIVSKIVPAS